MSLVPATEGSRLAVLWGKINARFKIVTFLSALGPTVFALALQLVAFAVTARGLGVEAFGQYTAILAVTTIGVELVGLGGADLLVRAVARDKSDFSRYFGNMLLLIAATLPVVVLVAAVIVKYPMQATLGIVMVIVAVLAEILIGRIAASLELVMVAHYHTTRASIVRTTTAGLRLGAAAVYFLLMKQHDLNGWIIVVAIQSIALSAIYVFAGSRMYGRPVLHFLKKDALDGAAFTVNQASRAAQSNMDRMILSAFTTHEILGLYGAASRVLQLGLFPIQVVTRILYPKFFEHGKAGIAATRRFAISSLPLIAGIGVFSGLAVAFASLFVPQVLGKSFAGATDVALKLAIAMPLIALQYPAADVLTGAGHQALRGVIYLLSALGFGFILALGAMVGGSDGVIYAFLGGHLLFLIVLWAAAFLCRDKPGQHAPLPDAGAQ